MTDSNTTTTSSPSIKKRKIKNGSSSRSASEVISDQLSQDVQPTRKSQKTAREIMEELRKNQQLQQDEENNEDDDEEQEVQDKSMEEYSSDSSNQDNSDVGNTSTTTLNLPVAISNFNPTFKNSKTFNSCHLFGMKKEESLVIQGQYLLTVQKGTVSIYGASLKSGSNLSYPVYAAFASALPKITCIKNENNTKQEEEENAIITNYNKEFLENKEFDAVIFIEPLTSGLETIPEYFPKYSNLWGYTDEEANYTTATSTVVGHPKPLYYGPSTIKSVTSYASWQVTANEICEDVFRKRATSIAFIAGPKNSGKSSFAKYLQNFFLSNQKNNQQQQLYFLDCDPGQSEFSPPSCLSLTKQTKLNFSCAFSHSNFQLGDLIKCHSLGSYSPKDLPEYFLACFEDLLTTFREEASQSSHASLLIINTPGWAKGQGLELLLEMIRLSQMSSVVFLGAKDLETFQDFHERLMAMSSYYQGGLIQRLCTPESPLTVSTINPSVQHNHDTMQQLFSATELRELQLLSYFHYSSKTSKFEFSCSTDSKTLAYIPPRQFQSSFSSSSSSSQLTAENDQSLNRGALFSQIPILDKSHSNRFIRPRSILASRETLSGTNILSFGEQLYEAVIKRERELNVPIHGIAIVGIDGIKKKHLHICIENVIVSVLSVKAQVLNEYNQELIPLFMTEEESNIPSTKKNSTNVDSENEQESSSYSSDNAEEEDKEEKSLNVPLPLIPSQWLMDIINPKSTKSLGLAMIKSIDPVTGTLDLQTPIDEETLLQVQTNDEVLILFRGRIPLPSWTTL